MKKLIIPFLSLSVVLLMYACTKNNDPSINLINGVAKGGFLQWNQKVPGTPLKFDPNNLATSTVSIKVKRYPGGSAMTGVNVYVGSSSSKSTWKLIKNVPMTDSGALSVTGADVAKAMGVNISTFAIGQQFTFYNEMVASNGVLYSMDNTNSADFESQAPYNASLRWNAVIFCNYDPTVFNNATYTVVRDDWADYPTPNQSPVTSTSSTTANVDGTYNISLLCYPNMDPVNGGANRRAVTLVVSPADNSVTVAKQIYGDYPPVTGASHAGTGSVNSCKGTITLNLTHYYGVNSYPGQVVILQKK